MTRSAVALLAAVAAAVALVVLSLLPYRTIEFLGRDESLYAVFGRLFARGAVCYRDFWDLHFPGLYYLYGWLFRAGDPAVPMQAVRWAHLLTQASAVGALALFARARVGPAAAAVAALAYAAAAISTQLEGETANTEPFALLFVFLGLWAAPWTEESGRSRRRDLLCGCLIGVGTLFKQHAALFLFVPPLASGRGGVARLPWLVLGWLAPHLAVGAYFTSLGALDDFLELAVWVPLFRWAPGVGLEDSLRGVTSLVWLFLHAHPVLVAGAMAAPGFAWVALRGEPSDERSRARGVLALLAVGAVLAAGGLRGLPHYLQFLAPGCAVAGGWAVTRFWSAPAARPGAILLAGLLALDVAESYWTAAGSHLGEYTPSAQARRWREADVGEYLQARTDPADPIFVWGPKPAIYYFADRSAPGRLYSLYPIVGPNVGRRAQADLPGAMEELRSSLERRPPRYVVLVPTLENYSLEQAHLAWIESWLRAGYERETVIGEYEVWRRR